MAESETRRRGPGVLRVILTAVACVILLAGAWGAVILIYNTEPRAERTGASRKTAALVETIEARRGSYYPQLVTLGTVEPAQDIILSPRVSGQVIELDREFVPGGFVQEGQLLLRIDPADFETTLAMRESDLHQARADLEIEKGRQDVARKEFEILNEEIDPDNRALVLREPQIESARARVEAAQAAVKRARLDLERTQIKAPFDAQILRRDVNVGSQVAPGDQLARLVGIDEYWTIVTVPLRHLRWVSFPDQDDEGSSVQLYDQGSWGRHVCREGKVERMIGTVDDETRLGRVLVTVRDPLSRRTKAPPLILGTLLEARITGREIADVTRLSRDYVRENDTVWVMEDGKLAIRDVQIILRDAEFAYIRDGLNDGDQVVTTNLATVAEGIGLRRADDHSDSPKTGGEETSE